jgi:hypothetical protein
MSLRALAFAAAAVLPAAAVAAPASAQDVNLTPKRVVFADGAHSSAEVIVFNRGASTATFKIDLVERAMRPDGAMVETGQPGPASAAPFVRLSPRRVTLAPGETQVVRMQVRRPEGLAHGEYRTHLTVSRVPQPGDAAQVLTGSAKGVSVQLRPVYGMSIPIVVRQGQVSAEAGIEDVKPVQERGVPAVAFVLARRGTASVYGDLEVALIEGDKARPIAMAKGVGVYPEIESRRVVLSLAKGAPVLKPGARLRVTYTDDDVRPGAVLARREVVLP